MEEKREVFNQRKTYESALVEKKEKYKSKGSSLSAMVEKEKYKSNRRSMSAMVKKREVLK